MYLRDQWLDDVILDLDELLKGLFLALLQLLELRLILGFGLLLVFSQHFDLSSGLL